MGIISKLPVKQQGRRRNKLQTMIRRSSIGSLESMLSPDGNTLLGSQDVSMEYLDDSSSALFPQMIEVPAPPVNSNQMVPPEAPRQLKQRRVRTSQLSAEEKKAKRKLNDEKYRQKKKAKMEALKTEVETLRKYCADRDDVSRRLEEQIKLVEKLTAENDQLKEKSKRLENSEGQYLAEDLQRPLSYVSNPSCDLDDHDLEGYQGTGSSSTHQALSPLGGYEGYQLLCNFDAVVTDFITKLDQDVKSTVKFSDFVGLEGERETVGTYSFPASLVPTLESITKAFGDVTAGCLLNHDLVENAYILFCATVHEMNQFSLEKVNESRILKWRDTIKDAMRINCNVCFAMEHLKKIALAYFGLKALEDLWGVDKQISKLQNELYVLWHQCNKMEHQLTALQEEKANREDLIHLKSKQCEGCIASVQDFRGKTLGSGLFNS